MMSCGQVPIPVVIPGDGTNLLLGEVVRHLAHAPLLVGEREINHLRCLLETWAGRLRPMAPRPAWWLID